MYHDFQKNPYEQEVKVERADKASKRRADYAFRLAPNFRDVRFYVEAKKPHGDIASADNYFQTIRYGWNSQTPIAVLTDFEQFQIIDCRYKPNIDTAINHCIRKYHYSDYTNQDKFSEIYFLFSRESVSRNAIDEFAECLPARRKGKGAQRSLFPGGYQKIDDSFLEQLDTYRTALAHAFKKSNPKLNGPSLTELTQRTLDRLVFIRFLEDKLIEPHHVISRFGDHGTAWQDFVAASHRLDGIYNGIVFKKHDFLDSPSLSLDDDSFHDICEDIYANSPYDFNVIPIHILGSIYERFLGKVIVSTNKDVTVEEKPEVRKAGGVYYTPDHIVNYIIEGTVGKLISGKTPAQISTMRFIDISCGSGSFLLGVYDLLLQYHTAFYNANPTKAKKGECIEKDGAMHLSLKKKREILLNNVYGVDIDPQAFEVAQLSLYLKLLEEETTSSAREHQLEFHETLLPSLNRNIICGNSVINRDVLEGRLFSGDEERRLNPMNYEDAFPAIIRSGGFDAVIGNPPWISLSGKFGNAIYSEDEIDYLIRRFDGNTYMPNMYEYFVAQGLNLTKTGGYFGYIVPDRLGFNNQFVSLRKRLLEESQIIDLVYKVPFPGVTADTLIFIVRKGPPSLNMSAEVREYGKAPLKRPQREFLEHPSNAFEYFEDAASQKLITKLGAT